MKKYEYITNQISSFTALFLSYARKTNWFFAYIAFIHWYISFFTDRFIFRYENISDGRLLAYKAIFLIIVFILWQLTAYAVKEYKHNQNIRDFIKYSLIYFTVMMVFLLLTWPGVWRCDEFMIIEKYRNMSVDSWNGPAIKYLYVYSMMLFPFPSGVAIVQNIIISMIVGYIILEFRKYFKTSRLSYLMYIPFLLFPAIDSNLYLMSTTLYGYLYLLLAVSIFIQYDVKITTYKVIFLITLAIIIAFFRKEGLISFFVLITLIFYCFKTTFKQKILILVLCLFFIIVNIVVAINNPNKGRYELANIAIALKDMERILYDEITEDKKNTELDLKSFDFERQTMKIKCYKMFDKVLDIQKLYENSQLEFKDFSDDEYSDFKKQYFLFLYENYKFFLQWKWLFFHRSSLLASTDRIFDDDFERDNEFVSELINLKSFQPISKEIRRKVLHFMEIELGSYFVKIFYNKIILIICSFVFVFIAVLLKNKVLFFLWSMILIQTIAMFFMTPSESFSYYFYLYLCCYVFLAIFFIKLLQTIRQKYIERY